MESDRTPNIKYPDDTPDVVKQTILTVLSEWLFHIEEVFSVKFEDGYVFTAVTSIVAGNYFICEGDTPDYPYIQYFEVDGGGKMFIYQLEPVMRDSPYLSSRVNNGGGWDTDLSTAEVMSEKLGVEDIFNLKPYEYGVIKLKYGIDPSGLFIPPTVQEHFKGNPSIGYELEVSC